MAHWLVDTAGIGSIIVFTVGLSVLVTYIFMLRWIQTTPSDPVPVTADQSEEEVATSEVGGEKA